MTVSPPTSTTSTADAKQSFADADMASISLQESESYNPPAHSPVHAETSKELLTTTSTTTDRDPELQWFFDIFQNAKGETFAKLFDLLARSNDQTEEIIHRQIKALPASNTERKAQLAIELLDLRMEQSWVQERKKIFLTDSKAQEAIREEVLVRIMGKTQSRNATQEHSPSKSRGQVQWQEIDQGDVKEEEDEQQAAYWKAKAEETQIAFERKRNEEEAKLRMRHEEEMATWRKKYEEELAKRRTEYEKDTSDWQKKMEEDSARWQRELEEDQAKWMKQDAEEYARWQKEEAEDVARWKKNDGEYQTKWQKKHAEDVARRRIKNTEELVKIRGREAQERARLRAKEAADFFASTEQDSSKTKNEI